MQSETEENGRERVCRVNKQTVQGRELHSKQADGGRKRVAEYTGRGWKGESLQSKRAEDGRERVCRVNRQRMEGRVAE